jgi:hypothetical protein
MLYQLHMFYTTEEIFSFPGSMVMLGDILVWTKVQSAVSQLVSFDYNKADEWSPTSGADCSNQHLPLLLYSASAYINHPKVHVTTNATVNRVARWLEGKGD